MYGAEKKLAAEAAVGEIVDGMKVGIGTGTTVAFAIAAIGARLAEVSNTRFFATSQATVRAAREVGIAITSFAEQSQLDLTIDGVDEIDPKFRAIKGGGGALLREKIVASASRRMVAIADASKQVVALGKAPVPVEVLPFARSFVAAQIFRLGGDPMLRMGRDIAYRTNQGNLILDCGFESLPDPEKLATQLQAIPGLLGHGLFLTEIDALYVAADGLVTKLERNPR